MLEAYTKLMGFYQEYKYLLIVQRFTWKFVSATELKNIFSHNCEFTSQL